MILDNVAAKSEELILRVGDADVIPVKCPASSGEQVNVIAEGVDAEHLLDLIQAAAAAYDGPWVDWTVLDEQNGATWGMGWLNPGFMETVPHVGGKVHIGWRDCGVGLFRSLDAMEENEDQHNWVLGINNEMQNKSAFLLPESWSIARPWVNGPKSQSKVYLAARYADGYGGYKLDWFENRIGGTLSVTFNGTQRRLYFTAAVEAAWFCPYPFNDWLVAELRTKGELEDLGPLFVGIAAGDKVNVPIDANVNTAIGGAADVYVSDAKASGELVVDIEKQLGGSQDTYSWWKDVMGAQDSPAEKAPEVAQALKAIQAGTVVSGIPQGVLSAVFPPSVSPPVETVDAPVNAFLGLHPKGIGHANGVDARNLIVAEATGRDRSLMLIGCQDVTEDVSDLLRELVVIVGWQTLPAHRVFVLLNPAAVLRGDPFLAAVPIERVSEVTVFDKRVRCALRGTVTNGYEGNFRVTGGWDIAVALGMMQMSAERPMFTARLRGDPVEVTGTLQSVGNGGVYQGGYPAIALDRIESIVVSARYMPTPFQPAAVLGEGLLGGGVALPTQVMPSFAWQDDKKARRALRLE